MARKPMSEEQKKAASERMRARWAEKNAQKVGDVLNSTPPIATTDIDTTGTAPIQPAETVSTEQTVADLQKQVEELKALFSQTAQPQALQPQMQMPQLNHAGKLVGRVDRYIIDPANYPNPCSRLSQEPRLQRFAFPINYELDFKVTSTSYQNQEGVNMREPKFTLELHKIVMDEDTGLATDGRYVICRSIFHEDPEAALVIARDNSVEVDQTNEKNFLDEMRYLRMRDWLLEAFYPKAAQPARQKKEVVVGGKLVEFFTVNSETAQSPFKDMDSSTKKL